MGDSLLLVIPHVLVAANRQNQKRYSAAAEISLGRDAISKSFNHRHFIRELQEAQPSTKPAIMKLSAQLFLPVIIGAASAASDASVYLFQGQEWPSSSNPPTLSPEEARLVFAQRLGVSQYHGIGEASESLLAHVNIFGGRQESIFQDSVRDKAAELVVLVQGVSSKTADPLLSAWSSIKPAFTISHPPSRKANLKLFEDLRRQVGQGKTCVLEDDINPFDDKCWKGKTKAIQIDLSLGDDLSITDLMAAQKRLIEFAKNNEMNVMVVLMPESGFTKIARPYGSYELPSEVLLGRRQAEEPMTDLPAVKSKQAMTSNATQPFEPITGVPPVCHSSLDSCMSSTNNCSGHGECYMKYDSAKGEDAGPACYACGCVETVEHFLDDEGNKKLLRITHWGGAACQKKDVSGPFWLFAGFTVVMIGLVSWAIGLLFSIGEEKLPGVIGAGVPSKSR